MRDKAAPVQALLGMRGKTRTHGRAAGEGQQSADARKQFAVDNCIHTDATQLGTYAQDVAHQGEAAAVVNRMHVLRFGKRQQAGDFLVLFELQYMDGRLRVAQTQRGKHRPGQHNAAHLRQKDDQNMARILRHHRRLAP